MRPRDGFATARGSLPGETTPLCPARVYSEHRIAVRAALIRLGVPDDQLEDAVQDVFVVLLRRLEDYDSSYGPRGWLMGIARRVASSYRRRLGRRSRFIHSFRVRNVREPDQAPDDHVAREEARELLGEFLSRLDREKSTVYFLSEVRGLRGPEIAEALGTNINTVYWRLRVAREEFDRMLASRRAERERPSHLAGLLAGFRFAWGESVAHASLLGTIGTTLWWGWPSLPHAAELPLEDDADTEIGSVDLGWYGTGAPLLEQSMELDPEVVFGGLGVPEPRPILELERHHERTAFGSRTAQRARPTPVAAPVAKATVFYTVRGHINEIRGCYNAALSRDRDAAGKIVLTFTVDSAGKVSDAFIESAEIPDEGLHECIVDAAMKWSFATVMESASEHVVVRYPFVLRPEQDAPENRDESNRDESSRDESSKATLAKVLEASREPRQ